MAYRQKNTYDISTIEEIAKLAEPFLNYILWGLVGYWGIFHIVVIFLGACILPLYYKSACRRLVIVATWMCVLLLLLGRYFALSFFNFHIVPDTSQQTCVANDDCIAIVDDCNMGCSCGIPVNSKFSHELHQRREKMCLVVPGHWICDRASCPQIECKGGSCQFQLWELFP